MNADRVEARGQRAIDALSWLTWADRDYLGARRLLLDHLLVQGAALANTALEKYLKAIFTLCQRRVPRVHDPLRLYGEIKEFPNNSLCLDELFLADLVKAYDLRYPDDLEPGYNIVLSQVLILSALDESVFEINRHFSIKKPNGEPVQRLLEAHIESKDPKVFASNTALKTISREEMLSRPSSVFEMRILADGVRMDIHYSTDRIDNPSFGREGFVPKNERQFDLSQVPNHNLNEGP